MTASSIRQHSMVLGSLLVFAGPLACDLSSEDGDDGATANDTDAYDDDDDDEDSDRPANSSDDSGPESNEGSALELTEALAIAQEQVSGAVVIAADLVDGSGEPYWDFDLYGDGTEYDVYVSAQDGSVLQVDQEALGPEDAAEAQAEAQLVSSSPGWPAVVAAAEAEVGGSAIELDVDAQIGSLEVYVVSGQTWTVEFDTDGDILDVDEA